MEMDHKCSCCNKILPISEYTIKKNNDYYKTCNTCREKNKRKKEDVKEGAKEIISEDGKRESNDDKKLKRENRPTISLQKQQIILKEQDYKCRGPGKYDNNEYECDMNVNGKRFCDKKSSEPQFDHIIRWKEGGNGIENIQALCASCHLMKTSMENIMNENKDCPSKRVKVVFESLSKPKYRKPELYLSESDSDDEFSQILIKKRFRRSYNSGK